MTEKRIDFLACFYIRLVACWGRILVHTIQAATAKVGTEEEEEAVRQVTTTKQTKPTVGNLY